MKILLINWQDIKNPFGGGAEVHMHEIFKRIVSQGHEVTLLCCDVPGFPSEEVIDGIKVIRKGSRSLFNFIVKKEYKRLSSETKFDIVIDDINKIPFYTPRFVKEPLIAISHHFFGKSIFREANIISASYVYGAEKIVDKVYKHTPFAVVSKSTLSEFMERGFDKKNFMIIPNAIEHKQFPMKAVQKNETPTVTYFGRLKKYKSVDHLLQAFAIVKKNIPNAKLEIMGKGDFMDYLKSLAVKLGIADDTTFWGFVTEEQKVDLLSKSHLVVNTSMKEGWGITNIEANACGTPSVSANVPGLRDSVKPGLSGQLYEYGDIDNLADIIINILQDKHLYQQLSEGSVEWAKSFSWDKSAEMMIEYCDKVIAEFKK